MQMCRLLQSSKDGEKRLNEVQATYEEAGMALNQYQLKIKLLQAKKDALVNLNLYHSM